MVTVVSCCCCCSRVLLLRWLVAAVVLICRRGCCCRGCGCLLLQNSCFVFLWSFLKWRWSFLLRWQSCPAVVVAAVSCWVVDCGRFLLRLFAVAVAVVLCCCHGHLLLLLLRSFLAVCGGWLVAICGNFGHFLVADVCCRDCSCFVLCGCFCSGGGCFCA